MNERVERIVAEIEAQVIARRRDLHRHAESGWTEFRTASLIAGQLQDLGYEVLVGREVIVEQERMGVPSAEVLEACWQRAREEGADRRFLDAMRGGFTGVVGIYHAPGPTVGLRFDIDALDIQESRDPDHRPAREGFASIHDRVAHACGHDAHAAVGLGVAQVLARLRDQVPGTVKLLFQPAEEGVRGAKSMVAKGVVDDVDWLLGHHVYSNWQVGEVMPGVGGYLATTKFDAFMCGQAAHASGDPQKGNNALLAAATAVLNLYAISRHRQGATRINVGRLTAGTGRNVIPDRAQLAIETRGKTTELNAYVYERAVQVLRAAADMYGCTLEIELMGEAQSADSDPALARWIGTVVERIGGFTQRPPEESGGSEDVTYMIKRVQERGGMAANIGIGADLGGWGHHTARFDLDERALAKAVRLLVHLTLGLTQDQFSDNL